MIPQRNPETNRYGKTISTAQCAKMLGVSPDTLRKWQKEGKLVTIRTAGGHLRYDVAEVERFRLNELLAATHKVAIVPQGIGRVHEKSGLLIPAGFDLITTNDELIEYTMAFAARKFNFLLLVGSPGSGKSRQMKASLTNIQHTWIDNSVSAVGLYAAVYEANNAPIVLDDVNNFLKQPEAVPLCKSLTQTEKSKSVSWQKFNKQLEALRIPKQFSTSSPVCMIANMWDAKNADMEAIQDRALPVAFYPDPEAIHNRVIELGWCKDSEIIAFIAANLDRIPQVSMRDYYNLGLWKDAGMDWKGKALKVWGIQP